MSGIRRIEHQQPYPSWFLIFTYLLLLPELFVLPERDELLLSPSSSLLLLAEVLEPLLLPVAVDFFAPAVVEVEERFSSLEEPCFSIIRVFVFKMVSVYIRCIKKIRAVLMQTTRIKKGLVFFLQTGQVWANNEDKVFFTTLKLHKAFFNTEEF